MDILKNLIKLKKLGASGVKQSLEDEGATFEDVKLMRRLSKKVGLPLNVKIGGCEAKNDIYFCQSIKVDSIVAPMVESGYALRKFLQVASKNKDKNCSLFVNFETINAFKNVDKIIKLNDFKQLKGVVVGRSDFVGSLNKSKSYVDSKTTFNHVFRLLKKLKKKNLITKMGGSLTANSKTFIEMLYKKKLLDIIETRNIEFFVNKKNINNLKLIIYEIFLFELNLIRYKSQRNNNLSRKKDLNARIKEMNKRLKKF